MQLRSFAICFALISCTSMAFAAPSKVTTQDGSVLTGEVSLKDGFYTIVAPFGTVRLPVSAVRAIEPLEAAAPVTTGPSPKMVEGPLRFAGSNTIGEELMPALIEAYAATKGASNPEWSQEEPEEQAFKATGPNNASFAAHLSRKGSATAFSALLKGQADIGMASREIKPEERASLVSAGFGDAKIPGQENVLALDGLVVIVHHDNPVRELTLDQIASIFAGEISDWSQVGGNAGPIHIYARDNNSGTYDTFATLVLKSKKLTSTAQRFESNGELSDKVSSDPTGIGFTGFAYVRNAQPLNISTACGMSFTPTEYGVRTEEYPLSRRLFLYTPSLPTNRDSVDFVNLALSSKGQAVVNAKNFINLEAEMAAPGYGQNRVAQAIALFPREQNRIEEFAQIATRGKRVSITFRFQSGSDALDSRATRDIQRAADYLRSPANVGRKVLVVGYTDNRGSDPRNQKLSQARAAAVATMLRDRGVVIGGVMGFARTAPVACNDPSGYEKNRRVELWLM